jgi:hypothetical protein
MDQQMINTIRVYVEFVRGLPGFKIYESKVSLESVIPDCWGTADALSMHAGKLIVVDLKTGGGVPVDAQDNTQLLCYALGAFIKFDPLYDFDEIELVIVQPPLESISIHSIGRQDLLDFANRLKDAYDRIVNQPETYVVSEKGCRWCPSKAQCPKQQAIAQKAMAEEFGNNLEYWLDNTDHLKSFIEAVEARAKDQLLSGKSINGWKVVEGRKAREWKDAAAAETYLKSLGYHELIYTEPQFKSVAQVEKALKKEAVDLSGHIQTKSGSPALAREDDKRQNLSKADSAALDFKSVVQHP